MAPNNLKKAREMKKLSQTEVAKQIGISQPMLAMLESGNRKGSDEIKVKLAKFYGESVDDLFFAQYFKVSEK